MRQAIQTKFLGPTNFRGSRVKAWCNAGSITVNWDHGSDTELNHWCAAKQLMVKLGWDEKNYFIGGGLPGKLGYCFVQFPRSVMSYKKYEELRDV